MSRSPSLIRRWKQFRRNSVERGIATLQEQITIASASVVEESHSSVEGENGTGATTGALKQGSIVVKAACLRLKMLLANAFTYSRFYTDGKQPDYESALLELETDSDWDENKEEEYLVLCNLVFCNQHHHIWLFSIKSFDRRQEFWISFLFIPHAA